MHTVTYYKCCELSAEWPLRRSSNRSQDNTGILRKWGGGGCNVISVYYYMVYIIYSVGQKCNIAHRCACWYQRLAVRSPCRRQLWQGSQASSFPWTCTFDIKISEGGRLFKVWRNIRVLFCFFLKLLHILMLIKCQQIYLLLFKKRIYDSKNKKVWVQHLTSEYFGEKILINLNSV